MGTARLARWFLTVKGFAMHGLGRSYVVLGLVAVLGLAACSSPALIPVDSVPRQVFPVPAVRQVSPRLPGILFTIQVGAFSTTERAARFAAGLISHGLDAYYFIDTDGLFKVRFERYQTREAALARAAALKAGGVIDDFFIVQPVPDAYRIDPQNALRNSIVSTARRFVGTPYRWGGESVQRGFDCSGLTMTVYRLNGLELPRNSRSQFDAGEPTPRDALKPGDLVFFATGRKGRVSHVGVYSGRGQFIHAPGQGRKIQAASMNSRYFRKRYMGARRYF